MNETSKPHSNWEIEAAIVAATNQASAIRFARENGQQAYASLKDAEATETLVARVRELEEQLEAALRVVEAAKIAYDGFGEDDHRFYGSQMRLAEVLAAYDAASNPASHPQLEDNEDPMWESGDASPAEKPQS